MTTNITVTDAQIEALRNEAGQAGDLVQVAICYRALGVGDGQDYASLPLDASKRDAVDAMTVTQARAKCAEVIIYAQGEMPDAS
jgi:hypothetical protein